MRVAVFMLCVVAGTPLTLYAQVQKPAPVEERASDAVPLQLQQQRSGAAYRDLTQVAFEARLAEQDVLNTQDAYNATRDRAEALRLELEKFIKVRDAARAKEAAARKRYDEALNAGTR